MSEAEPLMLSSASEPLTSTEVELSPAEEPRDTQNSSQGPFEQLMDDDEAPQQTNEVTNETPPDSPRSAEDEDRSPRNGEELINITLPTAKKAKKRKRISTFNEAKLLNTDILAAREMEKERLERLEKMKQNISETDHIQNVANVLLAADPDIIDLCDDKNEEEAFVGESSSGAASTSNHQASIEVIDISSGEEEVVTKSPRVTLSYPRRVPPPLYDGRRNRISLVDTAMMKRAQQIEKTRLLRRKYVDLDNIGPASDGRLLVNAGKPENEEDVFVASHLTHILQPHQLGGVRFMYDNVIETLAEYKRTGKLGGFGCILAHCMGLGKTIQVITFTEIFFRATRAHSVLIIVPINTIQNWFNEFNRWMPVYDDVGNRIRTFEVFLLGDAVKTLDQRLDLIEKWHKQGGVLLIGYDMFRLLVNMAKPKKSRPKLNFLGGKKIAEEFAENGKGDDEKTPGGKIKHDAHKLIRAALLDTGPDLVVCDEGHKIKNLNTDISNSLASIKTKRRIVLTGYPLQNNLMEYYCMVNFVRPDFLGTKKSFSAQFDRPIRNGQCLDSTAAEQKMARQRTHILIEMLRGFVQRRTQHLLRQILPESREFVIFVRKSPIQHVLYRAFVVAAKAELDSGMSTTFNPLKAFATCSKFWNHPDVLHRCLEKLRDKEREKEREKERAAKAASTPSTPENPVFFLPPPANGNPYQQAHLMNTVQQFPQQQHQIFTPQPNMMNRFDNFNGGLMGGGAFNLPSHGQNMSFNPNFPSNNLFPSTPGTSWQQPYSYQSNSQFSLSNAPYQAQQYNGNMNGMSLMSVGSTVNQAPSSSFHHSFSYPMLHSSPSTSSLASTPSSSKGFPPPTTTPSSLPAPVPSSPKKAKQKDTLATLLAEELDLDAGIKYDWAETSMAHYSPGRVENGPKMQIALAIIEAAAKAGEKTLLFSQNLATLTAVELFLSERRLICPQGECSWSKNTNYFRFDGSTSASEREKLINKFNRDPSVYLFLISTKAGSLGVNLVSASRCIIFDACWNPCHDAQAVCRIYRYGQQKKTFIYRLVMDNSMEKAIFSRQVSKQGLQQRVVDEQDVDANVTQNELENLLQYDESLDVLCSNGNEVAGWKLDDPLLMEIARTHHQFIAQEPFLHESLMLEREEGLSEQEKQEALLLFEKEKAESEVGATGFEGVGSGAAGFSGVGSGFSSSPYPPPSYSSGPYLNRNPVPSRMAPFLNRSRLSLDMAAAELPPMRSTPLPMHLMMSSGGRQMRGGTTLSSLPLTTFTARPNISKRTKDFLAQHAGTVGQSIGSGVDLVINRELTLPVFNRGFESVSVPSGTQVTLYESGRNTLLKTKGKLLVANGVDFSSMMKKAGNVRRKMSNSTPEVIELD